MEIPVTISDLSPANVALLLGLFLPLLTALVVKWDVDSRIRMLVNLVLAAMTTGLVTLVAPDGSFAWVTFVLTTLGVFLTSALAYVVGWKPLGAAAAIAGATAGFGVGPDPELVTKEVAGGSPVATVDDIAPTGDGGQDA